MAWSKEAFIKKRIIFQQDESGIAKEIGEVLVWSILLHGCET